MSRNTYRTRRRSLLTLIVAVAVLGTAGTAYAFWTAGANGNAAALAGSLSAPTNPTATANSATQITVGWTLPGSQLAGAQYRVTRTSGPGSPATVCTVASNVTSCADSGLSGSTAYGYSIIALLNNWQTTAITASTTTLSAFAADGSGTLTTPTTAVSAGSTGNTVTFTYTAATGGMSNGSVTLAVPSGWSAPSTTGSAAGFTTASTGTVGVSGQTITVSGVTVSGGGTFTIVYGSTASSGPGATATSSTGAQTWQAQQKSTSGGTLTNLAASPSITVFAADGSGTLTTPTTTVTASSTGNTITFTYTAATGGMSNGSVTLVAPSGWSAPSTTGSAAGFTTASTGTVGVSGQTITVSGVTVSGGGTFTIVYGSTASSGPGATATSSTGAQTWQAQQKSTSGGTLTNLAASPSITVNSALTITSVVRSGGNRKYSFTGTGASGATAVTVTICTANSFPCSGPNTAGTAVTGASPAAGWTTGADNNNLGNDVQYYARATQGAATSAVFPFVSTNTTPAVIPGGVALANGGSGTLGRADGSDTVTITYGEALDASSFCSTWTNSGVQSSSASIQIVDNASNDTLNNLTVGGCTFNFGSVALQRNYVSATVTFSTSTVSWDPATAKLTITLGGGTGQNTSVTAAVPSYTASTSITDQNSDAISAGPWSGTSSRF